MTLGQVADKTDGFDLQHEIQLRLVRSYDLRGVVGAELTEADAHALGLRLATAARARGGRRIAVGYDGRLSSPALAAALTAGLVAAGAEALTIGRGPTGMLYHAVHAHDLDGGVMVTGSHNPADQNGFKLLIGKAPVFGAALRALVEAPAAAAPGGDTVQLTVEDAYCARLLDAAKGAPALRAVWDPGNGAAGDIVSRLAAALPGEHHVINAEVDGNFPAHHPDPSVPDNLRQLRDAVLARHAHLGIAFDGDGDRIGVVDGDGEIVWPDQLLLFLAQAILRARPGAPIVFDVKSSRVLADGIAAAGGQAVLSPSGYVLVRERMLGKGAPLAGEMSGHIFYADGWDGTDDALHVAMRLLRALRAPDALTAFRRSLPVTFATPELRLPCADAEKAFVLSRVSDALAAEHAKVDRTDGLRVSEPDGWWLLRASGTEPKLTARVEGWSEAARDRLAAGLYARLTAAGWSA
ncbi:phosphomannomutase/phosphoglucomutase [uncultured Sphingomonas sp.]|uniref:phosphomannomutase/phosphoglucomutase n=1 Tax=uncultured Sphingomonas sp. TaxID=158754 RepID=UPI0035CC6211